MLAEFDRRLRIADGHDPSARGLTFANDEFEIAVAGLC
jgi:hypothetical protein